MSSPPRSIARERGAEPYPNPPVSWQCPHRGEKSTAKQCSTEYCTTDSQHDKTSHEPLPSLETEAKHPISRVLLNGRRGTGSCPCPVRVPCAVPAPRAPPRGPGPAPARARRTRRGGHRGPVPADPAGRTAPAPRTRPTTTPPAPRGRTTPEPHPRTATRTPEQTNNAHAQSPAAPSTTPEQTHPRTDK